jgi:hypothetical protein
MLYPIELGVLVYSCIISCLQLIAYDYWLMRDSWCTLVWCGQATLNTTLLHLKLYPLLRLQVRNEETIETNSGFSFLPPRQRPVGQEDRRETTILRSLTPHCPIFRARTSDKIPTKAKSGKPSKPGVHPVGAFRTLRLARDFVARGFGFWLWGGSLWKSGEVRQWNAL